MRASLFAQGTDCGRCGARTAPAPRWATLSMTTKVCPSRSGCRAGTTASVRGTPDEKRGAHRREAIFVPTAPLTLRSSQTRAGEHISPVQSRAWCPARLRAAQLAERLARRHPQRLRVAIRGGGLYLVLARCPRRLLAVVDLSMSSMTACPRDQCPRSNVPAHSACSALSRGVLALPHDA